MRIHVVDGTYELFRAHFAPRPPHVDAHGKDNKATIGMMMSLAALLTDPEEAVTHLAVAFDNPIRSFRNRLFDAYKSDEGVPPELRSQFDLAEEGTRALGIVVWSMNDHEADDAMATAAAKYSGPGVEVRLMTPDKDMGQCLVRPQVIQVDRRQRKSWNGTDLKAKWGFGPESIPDFLGLVGDTADGIPGLPGFGEKTAAALLSKYPHLEDIPTDAAQWSVAVRGAPKLSQTLEAHRAEAALYRKLATLVEDAPLPQTVEQLAWRGAPRQLFEAFCAREKSSGLLERPPRFQI